MKRGRSERDQRTYAALFYPGTDTLRNKLGIKDRALLEATEREITALRAAEGFKDINPLTYEGFKTIHRQLFRDLYPWAGEERTIVTGRNDAPFAPPEQITRWMEKQFAALRADQSLALATREEFAKRAAVRVGEINAAHPFLDGNGRTMRFWLRALAERSGYRLSFQSGDRDAWNKASALSFHKGDHEPMAALLNARLHDRCRNHPPSGREDGRER